MDGSLTALMTRQVYQKCKHFKKPYCMHAYYHNKPIMTHVRPKVRPQDTTCMQNRERCHKTVNPLLLKLRADPRNVQGLSHCLYRLVGWLHLGAGYAASYPQTSRPVRLSDD